MLGLECSTTCNRDMNTDSDWNKKPLKYGYGKEWERKRSNGWIKLLMRKFSEKQMKTGKYWTLFGKGNTNGLVMTAFYKKLLKAEWQVNQQEAEKNLNATYLANDDGYIAFKRAAQYRELWRHRGSTAKNLYKNLSTAEDYWTELL